MTLSWGDPLGPCPSEVYGLPPTAEWQELKDWFSQAGAVLRLLRLFVDWNTSRPRILLQSPQISLNVIRSTPFRSVPKHNPFQKSPFRSVPENNPCQFLHGAERIYSWTGTDWHGFVFQSWALWGPWGPMGPGRDLGPGPKLRSLVPAGSLQLGPGTRVPAGTHTIP